ncbi:MAG TPA: hypothetical protein VG603_02490, partial [Chitinophagales bacterium]|nr:hypothetical protein [Chitinophagales bacterium]
MKKLYTLLLVGSMFSQLFAGQNQYGVLYTILNTKCQNASCHNASTIATQGLNFDLDSAAVYQEIFNRPSSLYTSSSIDKHEMLVNPQMPY